MSYVCNDYTWNALDGLACGAALAIFLRESKPSRTAFQKALMVVLGIAIIIWAVGIPFGIATRQRPMGAALQVTPWHFPFVVFLRMCFVIGSGRYKRFVRLKSLRLLGEVSYGLYLYHLLIFALFDRYVTHTGVWFGRDPFFRLLSRFLIVSALAIAVSLFSRRMFEDRFLQLKRRLAP